MKSDSNTTFRAEIIFQHVQLNTDILISGFLTKMKTMTILNVKKCGDVHVLFIIQLSSSLRINIMNDNQAPMSKTGLWSFKIVLAIEPVSPTVIVN